MRTVIIIAGGFVLWAVCLGLARLFGGFSASSTTTATAAFVLLWCIAAAANMWIGVTRAGYTVGEELPIFLVIFLLPALVAIVAKWRFF
jgi:hypothetical protein